MTGPSIQGSQQQSQALDAALQAMFSQLVDNVLGSQAQDKTGKPLRDVCYMHLPQGRPIDPREFANPWSPSGVTIAATDNLGNLKPPPPTTTPAPGASGTTPAPDPAVAQAAEQNALAMNAARRTAELVDMRMLVTNDGSYKPYQGSELLSDAYNGVIMRAQGIPADPPPPDIQAKIDDAHKLLWVSNADGSISGRKTPAYLQYQQLSSAWAMARTNYAVGEAAAARDPNLGAVWPVTSSSLQMAVDNAWDDWRSNDADAIEDALSTLDSVGGSIGAYYVAQAREVYKAWDLGLTGAVPVGTPYAEISPETWYDPTDMQNGFATISVSSSSWAGSSFSSSSAEASSWYNGHSSSTGGGGAGMVFGITFGVDASSTDSNQAQGSQGSGGTFSTFSSSMSNVSITYDWGLCTVYRPFLLSELFIIDGWYLPGEPKNTVSDGTVGGAVAGQDHDEQHPDDPETHLLPMITTQFLVVRNVSITADGWGDTGTSMSNWCTQQQSSDQSSSNTVSGGVGFMGFGGYVSNTNADWSGQDSGSFGAARSWSYSGDDQHGTLQINGEQIVGWIGEILPASPRVDGTTQTTATSTDGSTAAGTTTTATSSSTNSTTTSATTGTSSTTTSGTAGSMNGTPATAGSTLVGTSTTPGV